MGKGKKKDHKQLNIGIAVAEGNERLASDLKAAINAPTPEINIKYDRLKDDPGGDINLMRVANGYEVWLKDSISKTGYRTVGLITFDGGLSFVENISPEELKTIMLFAAALGKMPSPPSSKS